MSSFRREAGASLVWIGKGGIMTVEPCLSCVEIVYNKNKMEILNEIKLVCYCNENRLERLSGIKLVC